MTITRAELDALRASLSKPELQMQLTPSGMTEQWVHQDLYKRHVKTLQIGEMSLKNAQKEWRKALEDARHQGHQRAHFNAQSHTHACNVKL